MSRPHIERELAASLIRELAQAKKEAIAAIGLRGEAARRAMMRERERMRDSRWAQIIKLGRNSASKRVCDADYRSTVSNSNSNAAQSKPIDTVESGETSDDQAGQSQTIVSAQCDDKAPDDESGGSKDECG